MATASTFKVRTVTRSRTLTNGTKHVRKYFVLMYQEPDAGAWREFPGAFTDRAQATRQGRDLCREIGA